MNRSKNELLRFSGSQFDGCLQESIVRDLSSKYFAQLTELEEIMECANMESESLLKLKQQIGEEESELQKLEYDLKIMNSSIQCKNVKLAEERNRLALLQEQVQYTFHSQNRKLVNQLLIIASLVSA